jgi:ribosomal protein S13
LTDFQREVVEYVKTYYQKKGKAPSISQIIKGIKNCSRAKIYDSFKGIEDICNQAEVPNPKDRIDKTKNLNRKSTKSTPIIVVKNNDIKLTKDQILRINTISHLEKGKSQSKIIDNLLNLDSSIRENELDHNKIKKVSQHIEDANKRGMNLETLLDLEIMLYNSGYTYLNSDELKKLNDIAKYLHSTKLNASEFIKIFNRFINIINIVMDYNSKKISYVEFKNRIDEV